MVTNVLDVLVSADTNIPVIEVDRGRWYRFQGCQGWWLGACQGVV